MRIVIFGKGYIGKRLAAAWQDAILVGTRIDDKQALLATIDEHRPDAIVNAAGRTGTPNVDWCETHQLETARDNTVGAITLAEACQERGVYLLHLGSGCVFYGPSPDPRGWTEDDYPNPSGMYSRTKYAADLILSRLPNVAIARLRMPIDAEPAPRNLITKLAAYKQVINVENSVTVIDDLVSALRQLIEKRGTGIFHVVNPGIMRHRDLLALYKQEVDPDHSCEWIENDDLVKRGLAARGRSNCLLQSRRLEELGIHLRPINVALRDVMQTYAVAKKTMMGLPPAAAPFNFLRQKSKREMKGVILAGGTGSRLAPLTRITNKHLLPIVNREMVLYPLQTLLDAGIRQIMLVTGPDFSGQFMNLLGSGASRGCAITYRIQDESGGIAQALGMAENFVDDHHCTVILGDNLFEDNFLPQITAFQSGAMIFYKQVSDSQRFGVVEMDETGRVRSIEEKPSQPKSNFAQTGLYVYDSSVFDVVRGLRPSGRGELEITDVNNAYLREGRLIAKPVKGFWSDAGTYPSMKRAIEYFASKEGIAERT